MKLRTLQLFQLFLLVFAFYALQNYSGNQRWLVSLVSLVTAFVVGKVETGFTERRKQNNGHHDDMTKKNETETTSQALDWLLKSKNVLLLTDAIQYLLQDLGILVSPSPDHAAIDRMVTIPGMQVTWGVKIISDIGDLNEDSDLWEELARFDLGRDGKRRLLIIASNSIKESGDPQQKYRNFSVNTHELLSSTRVVAMTTLTLCKIYLLCKKKNKDLQILLHPIQHYPGGVFQLEGFAS